MSNLKNLCYILYSPLKKKTVNAICLEFVHILFMYWILKWAGSNWSRCTFQVWIIFMFARGINSTIMYGKIASIFFKVLQPLSISDSRYNLPSRQSLQKLLAVKLTSVCTICMYIICDLSINISSRRAKKNVNKNVVHVLQCFLLKCVLDIIIAYIRTW